MIIEGNEGTEFVKDFYTGKANVKLLVINPTAQEKVDILGWSKKPETEPIYTGERDGVKTARIEINVETKEGVRFQHSFFVEKSPVVTKDGEKTQFVNEFGGFAYLPNDGSIPDNMSWYDTNNIRKAFKGEEQMVDFLKKWKDVRKGQKLAFSNFEAMFDGNFSEIKSLTSKNAIGIWVGIKQTFTDSGEAKYTQVIYPKYFVAQYVSGEDKPNPKGGVYKGWINGFTEALEGTRNAGGHLNVVYGTAPYTFTKVENPSKLPWLTGDNAATTDKKVEAPAF